MQELNKRYGPTRPYNDGKESECPGVTVRDVSRG